MADQPDQEPLHSLRIQNSTGSCVCQAKIPLDSGDMKFYIAACFSKMLTL
jgi:hypothetical protein